MRKHHQQTIDRFVAHCRTDPTLLAILVAGSIAKGKEREGSDVDLILVVTEEEYTRRRRERACTAVFEEFHDYEGGYVDVKYVDVPFLKDAARIGSEPTRNMLLGAFPAWSCLPEIDTLLAPISLYPEAERDGKIRSFYSQTLIQTFFIGEAERRNDPFLLADAASKMVFFGGRLLLAHNRVLFPSAKRLLETVETLPEKPEKFLEFAHRLVRRPTREAADEFLHCLQEFRDWGINWQTALGQYVEDSEFNWRDGHPPLADS